MKTLCQAHVSLLRNWMTDKPFCSVYCTILFSKMLWFRVDDSYPTSDLLFPLSDFGFFLTTVLLIPGWSEQSASQWHFNWAKVRPNLTLLNIFFQKWWTYHYQIFVVTERGCKHNPVGKLLGKEHVLTLKSWGMGWWEYSELLKGEIAVAGRGGITMNVIRRTSRCQKRWSEGKEMH